LERGKERKEEEKLMGEGRRRACLKGKVLKIQAKKGEPGGWGKRREVGGKRRIGRLEGER